MNSSRQPRKAKVHCNVPVWGLATPNSGIDELCLEEPKDSSVSIVLVEIVRKDRFNDGTLSDAVELGR
jgi:hypothetical protein